MFLAPTMNCLNRDLVLVAQNFNALLPQNSRNSREFLARIKPVVLLINESHLRPHNRVRLPNYVLYRADSPVRLSQRAAGGTAIAVKIIIACDCPRVVISREATAVELPGVLGGVLLVSAYKQPTTAVIDALIDTAVIDIDSLIGSHRKAILAGDLN